MIHERTFLNPERKLVDETADWLAARARRTACGAWSLAHLLVLAPTAQAARRLRFALAARFEATGVVPPAVKMPAHLLEHPKPRFPRRTP